MVWKLLVNEKDRMYWEQYNWLEMKQDVPTVYIGQLNVEKISVYWYVHLYGRNGIVLDDVQGIKTKKEALRIASIFKRRKTEGFYGRIQKEKEEVYSRIPKVR